MDTEKDFLKKDLGKAETKEEIEKLIDDAETMGHEDIAEMAKEKLAAVLAKAEAAETTSTAQVSQVESMGGSVDEVAKRTEGVDAEIDAVKAETEEKIAEVQGENVSETTQTDEQKKEDAEKFYELAADYLRQSQELKREIQKLKIELERAQSDYNNKTWKIGVASADLWIKEIADRTRGGIKLMNQKLEELEKSFLDAGNKRYGTKDYNNPRYFLEKEWEETGHSTGARANIGHVII